MAGHLPHLLGQLAVASAMTLVVGRLKLLSHDWLTPAADSRAAP